MSELPPVRMSLEGVDCLATGGTLPEAETGSHPLDSVILFTVGPRRLLEILLRPVMRPPLDLLNRAAALQSTDPYEIAESILKVSREDFRQLQAESIPANPSKRESQHAASHSWGMSASEIALLFAVVRSSKPRQVVETGVARGESTRAILRALAVNRSGKLDSFEVSGDVGDLVDPELRSSWSLHVLPKFARRRAFSEALEELGPLDMFIHDSRHTYAWQLAEYHSGWRCVRPGGLLLSDDIDSSFAFIDFCTVVRQRPSILVTPSKAFGVIRKPKEDSDA